MTLSPAGAASPYGRARVVSSHGRQLAALEGEVLAAAPGWLELQLAQGAAADAGLAPDDEVFLALHGGPMGCWLTPAIVVRRTLPGTLTLRLPAADGLGLQGRAHFRVEAALDILVQAAAGGGRRTLRTVNVSAGGVLVADPTAAVPGERHHLCLRLPGGEARLIGRVVRAEARGTAYAYESVPDVVRSFLQREMLALERAIRLQGRGGSSAR